MPQDAIYFTHANGFPSGCYRKFLSALQDEYPVGFLEQVGHDPDYPVTDNWEYLVAEILQDIRSRYDVPVIAMGHSMGGLLSYAAAARHPEYFKAVILLDAPVFGILKSQLIRLLKRLDLMHHITPARLTKRRRHHWETQQDAINYLRARKVYQHFDEDCLRDYAQHGMEQTAEGVALKFDRDIEHDIYQTFPDNLRGMRRHISCPIMLLFGEESAYINKMDLFYMRHILNIQYKSIKGGHLFPFEYPLEAAHLLKKVIRSVIC